MSRRAGRTRRAGGWLPRLAFVLALIVPAVVSRPAGAQPVAASPVATAAAGAPELLRTLLAGVSQRLIEASRQLSPSLGERVESLLQDRANAAERVPRSAGARTGSALLRVGGVSMIGLAIALVVLVTALGPLEGIIRTVEADVSGAFWRGVVAQAIALPVLALVLLGLAVTVVGLLAVPIALLASTLLVAGAGTLGVLAVAAVIGRARASGPAARSRAGLLRALIIGYALLWLPWLIAALLVAVPGVGLGARVIALASTWVVATVGLGAVVRSRAGRRVPDVVPARAAVGAPMPAPDWATPTPVSGIVAARLPSAAAD